MIQEDSSLDRISITFMTPRFACIMYLPSRSRRPSSYRIPVEWRGRGQYQIQTHVSEVRSKQSSKAAKHTVGIFGVIYTRSSVFYKYELPFPHCTIGIVWHTDQYPPQIFLIHTTQLAYQSLIRHHGDCELRQRRPPFLVSQKEL
jgi:hypothetical protein